MMNRSIFYTLNDVIIFLYQCFYDIMCVMLIFLILVFHILFFSYPGFIQDMTKIGCENQDKEAQHHTHYIIKTLVQENNYIVKCIKYTPVHFIKSCSSQTKGLLMCHISYEFS